MNSPEVSYEEAIKFRGWLRQLGLELYTTVIADKIYLVGVKDERTGRFIQEIKREDKVGE